MSKSRTKPRSVVISSSEVEDFAEIFNALSHPHRLQIFIKLAMQCCPGKPSSELEARACVSDAGKGLDIAASTLSHHIKELRSAGLIRMERSGQTTECWVEPEVVERLKGFFTKIGGCK